MILWSRFLGRRNVMIACAAVVIVAIGAGLGIYLSTRSHPVQTAATKHVGPAPSVAPPGTKAVATPQQAVFLTVTKTVPAAGSRGNALDTAITIDFNLPVTAAQVTGFLGVVAPGSQTPTVKGTVRQGATDSEVVFTPSAAFQPNGTVQVTLRSGLQSADGSSLDNDYSFNFATIPDPRTVSFIADYQGIARLVNAASGKPVNLTIEVGEGIPGNVQLKTYRASVQDLLNSLVYTDNGYAQRPVNTASMGLVDNGGTTITASGARITSVLQGADVTVSQPDGLYVVVAVDPNNQYGAVFVNFSKYAILLRQDDQRVVVAGEDLSSGAATTQFAISFYNLQNGVHVKASSTFTGTAEIPAKFPSGFDLAVAQAGDQNVIVPMAAPETNAEIKVTTDLSQQLKVFVTTDRLAYHKGDTVRFGGAVRLSNDQAYTLGSGVKVQVWSPLSGALATVTAVADGTFSGSFVMPAAAFNADGTDNVFLILAQAPSTTVASPYLVTASTTIVAAGTHSPATSVTVTFDKASYLAGDTIVAGIAGPANGTVMVGVFASQHAVHPIEVEAFNGPSSWGDSVVSDVRVKLDATGHGTYSVKANVAQKAADEEITVAATYGTGAAQAVGARTAVVYQAADEVFLVPGRLAYRAGDNVIASFVVEARDGSRVPGAAMSYELDSTDYSGSAAITTVVGSGTVTTDANGVGVLRTPMATQGDITLRVKGKDAAGNVFADEVGLGLEVFGNFDYGGGFNPRLDVLTDKLAYAPGESAVLTVTSPAAETALLSLERGRIHDYRLVQLVKGDNTLHVTITPDLAPGFNAVLSYFQGGDYTSQSVPIKVNNSARMVTVKLTSDQATYTKGQTARVTIAVADAGGAAVAASALVDGYDARTSAFKLVDKDSLAGAFLTPDPPTTNASSSLLGIGTSGGRCGGGYFAGTPDPTFAGQAVVWSPDLVIDASGHATVQVPVSVPVRLVVFVGTKNSGWGQAEIDLVVQ